MSSLFTHRPIGIDLFAGAGGMSLGFEQAGFDLVGAVELDPIHCATHQYNFPLTPLLCKSVTEVTVEEIENKFGIKNRDIDVVFGGSPCQGFSVMGKRTLDDPRNSLIFHFVRLLLELKPKYFVIENVKGLITKKYQAFAEAVVREIESAGYIIHRPLQVLNAVNYGVPQRRERLFILGAREGLTIPQYPQILTTRAKPDVSQKQSSFAFSPTVWDAIGDLPEVEDFKELKERDWVMLTQKDEPLSEYGRQLHQLKRTDNDYSYRRNFNPKLLTSSSRTNHRPKSVARFSKTTPGKTEPVSRFHRLHPAGVSNTLRAGTPSSRGAYTSARPIHPYTPRCITVREAARLHSYPDWFRFHVTKWHGFRQVGNSVPPLLAKAVATEIIKALEYIPSQPQKSLELGEVSLLKLTMSQAANFYGVDPHVIAPRTRRKRD